MSSPLTIFKSGPKVTAKDTTTNGASAPESRIRYRERRYTKEGLCEDSDATSLAKSNDSEKSKDSRSQPVKHAMTFLRSFDEDEKYEYSIITIEDESLHALLFQTLSHFPGYSHQGPITLSSRFEPIIHKWSQLNDLSSDDESKAVVAELLGEISSAESTSYLTPLKNAENLQQARADLKNLLEQVKNTPGLEDWFSGPSNENNSTVSFEYLWTIFPPGELVFTQTNMGQPQVFIVKECTDYFFEGRRGGGRFWRFVCWSYDWDGTTFSRVPVVFKFEDFKGKKQISTLHCYPLRFYRGSSGNGGTVDGAESVKAIKAELIIRGKRYRELCLKEQGKQIFEYNGVALARGSGVRHVGEDKKVSAIGQLGFIAQQLHSERLRMLGHLAKEPH